MCIKVSSGHDPGKQLKGPHLDVIKWILHIIFLKAVAGILSYLLLSFAIPQIVKAKKRSTLSSGYRGVKAEMRANVCQVEDAEPRWSFRGIQTSTCTRAALLCVSCCLQPAPLTAPLPGLSRFSQAEPALLPARLLLSTASGFEYSILKIKNHFNTS